MELSYWKSRWRSNRTGWHMDRVYPHLVTYWDRLDLDKRASILVPLCGKSLDLLWLAELGYRVTGVEISELAISRLFDEAGITPQVETRGGFTAFRSARITVLCGDFFKLTPGDLPAPDAIYDKAALIALPPGKRRDYASQVLRFCGPGTQILLNTFEYEQGEMTGPPFAVFGEELDELYGERFDRQLLHEESLFDSLAEFRRRGLKTYLTEKVYLLKPS